jgi:hypothetical protein
MHKPSPAMIVALLGVFLGLGGVGVAATGGNFILGQSNSADRTTALAAPVPGGKTLQLTNGDTTNAASTALGLNVASGHAPFTVNSGAKVVGLNADKLDGIDSTGFLPKAGKAVDADKLDGIDSPAFQKRVSGNCALGSAIRSIANNGAVTCQAAGSLAGTACTRSGGGSGSVVVRVRRDNTIELTCESASGYQSLAVTEEVAQTVADFLVAGDRAVEVVQDCAANITFGCVGGQPVNPAPTIGMKGLDVFVDKVAHEPSYDGHAYVSLKTAQAIPVSTLGLDCSISIDTTPLALPLAFRLNFVNLEDPASAPDRIGVSDMSLSGFTVDYYDVSGGLACAALNIPASVVSDLITNSISAQMEGGLCGAPGPELFMRCTQG